MQHKSAKFNVTLTMHEYPSLFKNRFAWQIQVHELNLLIMCRCTYCCIRCEYVARTTGLYLK